MKWKLLLPFLLLSLIGAGAATAASINGTYNGNPIVRVLAGGKELVAQDVPAQIVDGRTMVPLYLLRELGANVTWDSETYSVHVEMPEPEPMPVLSTQELEELAKSVYMIRSYSTDGKSVTQGTGFIVNGVLVTNFHVVDDMKYAEVKIDGKWQRVGEMLFADQYEDLAGFKVSGGTQLAVSSELPGVGDPVYAIGYPNGELSITIGKVTKIRMLGGIYIIGHDAKLDGGSSGSPLFNGSGRVIGINRDGGLFQGKYWGSTVPIMYVEQHTKAL